MIDVEMGQNLKMECPETSSLFHSSILLSFEFILLVFVYSDAMPHLGKSQITNEKTAVFVTRTRI